MLKIPEPEEMELTCKSWACKKNRRTFRRVIYTEKEWPQPLAFRPFRIGGPPPPPSLPYAKYHELPFAYCLECNAMQYIGPEPKNAAEEIERERERIQGKFNEDREKRHC